MNDEYAPIPIATVRESIERALEQTRELAKAVGRGEGGREVSLTITKLEEAQLWLSKVR